MSNFKNENITDEKSAVNSSMEFPVGAYTFINNDQVQIDPHNIPEYIIKHQKECQDCKRKSFRRSMTEITEEYKKNSTKKLNNE